MARKRLLRAAATAKRNRNLSYSGNPYHQDSRQSYLARLSAKNAKKAARNLRQQTQKERDQIATGKRREHLDRIQQRSAAAQLRLTQWSQAEQDALINQISALLERINYHRDADSAIKLNQLPLFPFAGSHGQ